MDPPPAKSWSIHTRLEIIQKYQILERVGSGAYSDVYRARRHSDVYRARRLSDDAVVALKEVHDYQSAFREIEALQILRNSPNVVVLHEYFWREGEDAVLVLEYLRTDLASLIANAKKRNGIGVGELKRWMLQILSGVDACHRRMIVHRDLKPSNLLIGDDGVLKLADFGQARILMEPGYVIVENPLNEAESIQPHEVTPQTESSCQERHTGQEQEYGSMSKEEEYLRVSDEVKAKDFDKDTKIHDGDTSCLATCTTSDIDDDDPFKSSYSYEAEEIGDDNKNGCLTSCVGTRWFKAPELLYGSTDYGLEVDLWSLGCIFTELFSLEPLFPGSADIDQLSRIISVLGNLTEEVWPGCAKLPDYRIISFNKVENPFGLEACLHNRSPAEVSLVERFVRYDPASRATAMELLQDKYFSEEPLPVPLCELIVPLTKNAQDEDYPRGWRDYNDISSDSDFDDFGPAIFTTTSAGFSIRFS